MAAFDSGAVSSGFERTSPARFFGDDHNRTNFANGEIGENGIQLRKPHESDGFKAPEGKNIFEP